MSGSRRRDEVAPTLFPFLAVLLCTMGALVLILMLIVSGAQATAREVAEAVDAEQISQEMVALSDEMQKVRAEQQKEIDRQQGELAHIENHIDRLQKEIEALITKYEMLDAEKDQNAVAQKNEWEKKKEELLEQIADAQEELKEKEEEAKNKKPAYSIIPYQGPNGTSRRPIYLECVADGLLVQPGGFKLTLRDLRPPYGPGNPLDAVLRAIRAHLESIQATGGVAPYPLLIVRPDGIRTYALARGAMTSWDDQFGYELVDNDMDLKFPPFEKPLNAELERVVVQARERQVALIAAMPNRMRGMMGDELGDEEGDSYGPIGGGEGGLAGNGSSDEYGNGGFGNEGYGSGGIGREGSGDVGFDGTGNATGSTGLAGAAFGQPRVSGQANSGGLGSSLAASDSATGTKPGSLTGNGSETDSQLKLGNSGELAMGTSNDAVLGNGSNPAAGSGYSGDGMAQTEAGKPAGERNPNTGIDGQGSPDSSNSTALNSTAIANGQAAGSSQVTGQRAQAGKASSTPPPEGSVWREMQGGGDSAMGPAGGEAGPGFTLSSSKAANAQQPPSDDKTNKPAKPSESGPSGNGVVVSHGSDWTRQNIRGTAVERTIRIRCQEDRWVIQPEPGQQGTKTIFLRKGLPQARTDLAKALQGRVDGWGMALAGGYWKPKIVVDVDPNAENRYEQLQRVLQGSGMDISKEESANGQKPK
jgi:Skp family chaperone for outer membrane proteins